MSRRLRHTASAVEQIGNKIYAWVLIEGTAGRVHDAL
jgi:hypothetical protein